MAGIYKVAIYDTKIVGLFGTTQDAARFVRTWQRATIHAALQLVPVGYTGRLALGHRTTGPYRTGGPLHLAGQVYNAVAHAEYVHNGTLDKMIVAKNGKYMAIPRGQLRRAGFANRADYADPGKVHRQKVKGQRANPWLAKAGKAAERFVESSFRAGR